MTSCCHPAGASCIGVYVIRVGFAIERPPSPRNIRHRHVAVSACSRIDAEHTAIAMICAMDDEHTRDHQVGKGHRITKAYPQTIGHMPGRVEMPTSAEVVDYCE